MKNKIQIQVLVLLASTLVFSGCITKSAYEISTPEELSQYGYITIAPLSDGTEKNTAFEKELAAVYADAGLEVLAQEEVSTLPEVARQKVLLAEYDMEEGSLETVVNIFYSDSQSHSEVAYCRGTWGLKNKVKNEELARDNAVNQTRYMFGLGDEMGEYNKYSWY